jgi:hypothetical protein
LFQVLEGDLIAKLVNQQIVLEALQSDGKLDLAVADNVRKAQLESVHGSVAPFRYRDRF